MHCLQLNGGGKLVQKSSNMENWKRQQGEILGRWMEGRWVPLLEKYPRFYRISKQQQHYIHQMGSVSRGGVGMAS